MSESVRGQNRFDFQTEVVDINDETGQVTFRLRPDPGRYEWRERTGERALYDRFDDVYFPHALVMDAFKRVLQMTPGPALGVIPDIAEYAASRRSAIAAALRGEQVDGSLLDLSEAELRHFEKRHTRGVGGGLPSVSDLSRGRANDYSRRDGVHQRAG